MQFDFKDYRKVDGRFDRIVSVGMFEHVGVNHYSTFFRKVRDLLAERRPHPHPCKVCLDLAISSRRR